MSMTESEARKEIIESGINLGAGDYVDIEALEVAAKALEEVEQYRATGLTPSMVHDLIKSCKAHEKNALENAHIVDEYRAIGTIERFRELTEKAEPKKPLNIRPNDTLAAIFDCPSCGRTQKIQYQGFHCKECGQNLDWE